MFERKDKRDPSVGVPRNLPEDAPGVPAPTDQSTTELVQLPAEPLPLEPAQEAAPAPAEEQAADDDAPKPYDPASATPHEHAVQLGNLAPEYNGPRFGSRRQRYSWQHEAAAQLHGWARYELDGHPEPFRLSREDYESALKATAPEAPKKGQPAPPMRAHEAAIAKAPKGDG